ncbi:2Fe-2S iron-sulfur cluster binding domain-containing protein [Alkalihalobacillus sp. LMS39]|uniref:2Fe-2S iron-sulfur cluster-binding protein n=1 Tax=Alkalihalobacillus sp. LMS39 TaxID=2924032 RepID=UPI001FB29E4C|nr:2Fe-2S iron-sulfur cluster binding domain-containing protein [Alkalihalobacillus sp. LMS39]UOE94031.1 2Fe-2S iron-sulfur cluster binding domain-containing protein [Alkalihalobacillus sp. LMS39]
MQKKLTVGSLIEGKQNNIHIENAIVEKKTVEKQEKRKTKEVEKKSIEIEQHGRRYEVQPEQNVSVLEQALNQKVPIDYKCKKGSCGKCEVTIVSGHGMLSKRTDEEIAKLTEPTHRLACQAVFQQYY